jgi:hypothetical protein
LPFGNERFSSAELKFFFCIDAMFHLFASLCIVQAFRGERIEDLPPASAPSIQSVDGNRELILMAARAQAWGTVWIGPRWSRHGREGS